MKYRGYTITREHPPIPGVWWAYVHKDYDGPEDNRSGHESSPEACKDAIDDHLDPSTPPPKQPKEDNA